MYRYKKITILAGVFLAALSLAACRQENRIQESSTQEAEDTGSEAAADELLDSFINGSVSAVDSADPASTFFITDLNHVDSEERECYRWHNLHKFKKVM